MKMNRPSDELLEQYAPLSMWRVAEKQAERSPHKRHRTGCVIFYGMGNTPRLYATGAAHPHAGGRRSFSVHAEMHAVSRIPPDHGGAVCLLVTLTKAGNYATNSRPCEQCAHLLAKHVWGVIYAEMTNVGTWAIRRASANDLCDGFLMRTKVNS
jgi:hypothetical protein